MAYRPLPNPSVLQRHVNPFNTGIVLFCGAGAGFVSAVSIAAVLLPWSRARTAVQYACLAVSVITAAVYGALALVGCTKLRSPVLRWILIGLVACCAIHLCSDVGLVWALKTEASIRDWQAYCQASNTGLSQSDCESRLRIMQSLLPVAQLILPIAGTALCYYVYLFTTHPTYVSSLSSPSCDGAVPYNWDKLPSSYAEDSNASSSDSENDESSEAGAGQRLLRGRRGSAFPTTEVGKSRRERTGRSWSYVDYQRARSSKEGSQASGSERKGREKRGRGSVTTAGEGASGRV